MQCGFRPKGADGGSRETLGSLVTMGSQRACRASAAVTASSKSEQDKLERLLDDTAIDGRYRNTLRIADSSPLSFFGARFDHGPRSRARFGMGFSVQQISQSRLTVRLMCTQIRVLKPCSAPILRMQNTNSFRSSPVKLAYAAYQSTHW